MNIKIASRGFQLSASVIDFIHHRAKRRLGRLAHATNSIRVKISDLNGPKGGIDKRCQVVMQIPGYPPLVTAMVSDNPYKAIDNSLLRAKLKLTKHQARKTKMRF